MTNIESQVEEWRGVTLYPIYSISSMGRVKNSKTGRILKQACDKNGYLRVVLCMNRFRKMYLTHRLVAEAFIINAENKRTVDHINKTRNDNRVNNLRWATTEENNRNKNVYHKSKTGISGVWRNEKKSKWQVYIRYKQRLIHLGFFIDFEQAVKARRDAEVKYGFT